MKWEGEFQLCGYEFSFHAQNGEVLCVRIIKWGRSGKQISAILL
jgi:hypothetical protein